MWFLDPTGAKSRIIPYVCPAQNGSDELFGQDRQIVRGTGYVDLAPNYFDERGQDFLRQHLVKRLENLGLNVTF